MELRAAILAVAVYAGAAGAQTPSFALVGSPAGASYNQIFGLSADGSVAAGMDLFPSLHNAGFTWTAQGGRSDFGLLPGMPTTTSAFGISGDGSTVVGQMIVADSLPYRRVGDGPVTSLGLVANYTRGLAYGVSGDGSAVVGKCERGPNSSYDGQAFLWTPQGGMQGLGFIGTGSFYSEALGISRDGTTVVGDSVRNFDGATDPFVWRAGTGMVALPIYPGAAHAALAHAVNFDGSIVVGESLMPSGLNHAVEWLNGGSPMDLGTLLGYRSIARALSDDGSVIGGNAYTSAGPSLAFVWTPGTGMLPLSDYLASNGVTIPSGWTLNETTAVSADGMTFAGWASAPGQISQGFVATIPAPSSVVPVLALCVSSMRRRRTRAPGR